MSYEFTSDWFSPQIAVWERHLLPLAGRPLKFLEIGSYEGRSAVWVLEHLLASPDGLLVCLDTWGRREIRDRFLRNVTATGRGQQLVAIAGEARRVLREWLVPGARTTIWPPDGPQEHPREFDVIYVDCLHRGHWKVELAVLVWPLLRPGGLLVFDDYRRSIPLGEPGEGLPPRPGLDAFVSLWGHGLEVVHAGYQLMVRKRGG